ncbi:MAG TPA: ABC transporter permease [Ferruginibacter sp.]|nr:ABC transporter permease [Ferruginibacter sp.]
MFNLFKIEWLKIKTYRTFWILFGGFLISFPIGFSLLAYKYMESMQNTKTIEENLLKALLDAPFVFPKVWHASGWMGGMFFILIAMLFILLITNEVQYRTHRQNIIDGWSRMDFLKAKFSVLIFFVVVSTLVVFIMGLIVGSIYSTSTTNIFAGVYYVGYFALMATLYLMLAFLIAILIKRTGLAIIIYFAIVCIVDNVIGGIFTIRESQLGYYMPLEVVDSLLPFPFKPKILEKRTMADYTLVIGAFAYMAVYAYIFINYFRKTDLKT